MSGQKFGDPDWATPSASTPTVSDTGAGGGGSDSWTASSGNQNFNTMANPNAAGLSNASR